MDRISIKTIELLSDPDIFLGLAGSESVNQLLSITKTLYDTRMNTVQSSSKTSADILPQLFVENFDNEQIFQQLELLNDDSVDRHRQKLAALKSLAARKKKNDSRSLTDNKLKKSSAAKKKILQEDIETKSKKKTKTVPAKKIKGKKQVHFSDGDDDDDDDDLENKSDPANESDIESIELEDIPNKKSSLKDKFDKMGSDIEAEDDEDESEEEKELKKLLEKVTAKPGKQLGDGGSDEESDISDLASGDEGEDDEDDDDDDKSSDSDAEVKQKASAAVGKLKDKLRSMNERQKASSAKRKSVVDDRFFKLSEMESFLDEQDLREQRAQRRETTHDDTDTEDEDDDDDDDEVETPYMYNDFFDPPADGDFTAVNEDKDAAASDDDDEKDVEMRSDDNAEVSDGSDAESGRSGSESDAGSEQEELSEQQVEKGNSDQKADKPNTEKSAFEKRQEKLHVKIAELEERNLKQKSWQMSGEVAATARPENSLLQENIDFEFMTRQAPVITETTTNKLEELILQRIKDKAWDDVERKARPTDKMATYSKRVVLDQEKNKMSLSQIYEQQFLKQSQKSDGDGADKVDPKHVDIRTVMQSLFVKLDALANFHYTPKPVVQDVKIVSNVPALSLEEAIPSAVSDAALLAPEEVEPKRRHELLGASEMTLIDRRRARRQKKKNQKAKRRQREDAEKQKDGKTATDTKDNTKNILAAVMAAGGKVEKAVEGKSRKRGRMKDLMETGGKLEKRKKMKLAVSPAPRIKRSRTSVKSSR